MISPMKVAIITPYYKESLDVLARCHQSVLKQSVSAIHFMIADGHPRNELDHWDVQHIRLPQSHQNYGDTPRAVGCMSAIGQQFEAIFFLDADNWYYPEHVETLLRLRHQTGATVCTSQRMFYRLDNTPLGECPLTGLGSLFIDTNCLGVFQEGFHVLHHWSSMPPVMHAIGDRYMAWMCYKHELKRAHSPKVTVAYQTAFQGDYLMFGENPPTEGKQDSRLREALIWWQKQGKVPLKAPYLRKPTRITHPDEQVEKSLPRESKPVLPAL
jgi:hypothetical protein